MLVALSDTHGTETMGLTDHLQDVLGEAEQVLHTGDFTTPTVFEAFEKRARQLVAVQGNRDTLALKERLPDTRTLEALDRRFVLAHGHQHDETALSLLGRQEQADVVLVGHSHRPRIAQYDTVTVINPGSHADPRGNQAAYVRFEQSEDGVVGRLRSVDGGEIDTVEL